MPLAIDEFPVFFIAAAVAEGETLVTGAAELRVKESDRLAAMAAGLNALGVRTSCSRMACGSMAARSGVALSTAMGITASPWLLRSPPRGAPSRSGSMDVANVATSFPGFADLARGIGLQIED